MLPLSIQSKIDAVDITISMSVIYFSLNTQGLDYNTTRLGMIISSLACPFYVMEQKYGVFQRTIDDTHWNCYISCIYFALNTQGQQRAGLKYQINLFLAIWPNMNIEYVRCNPLKGNSGGEIFSRKIHTKGRKLSPKTILVSI